MSEKTYRTTLEVRGYELDSFGHVNHSVYLNYMEHGRWRMLADEGIVAEEITRQQLWPVIAGIEIKYLKPAFMRDILEVRTRVVEHGRVRFALEQTIFRGETQLISAKVTSVIVNAAGRPVEIPAEYHRIWS